MASIRPRTLADGSTVYAVIWREGGSRTGKQTSQTFDDEARAQTLKRFLEANGHSFTLASQAAEQALAAGLTIKEAAQRWLTTATGIQDATHTNYERSIRLHINPTLGNRLAADLEKDDIRAWIKRLEDQGSQPSTIRLYHATLYGIMSWVIEQKIRPDNPCKGIRLPRIDKTRTRGKLIEHDDYTTIVLPEIPEQYRPIVELIAGTGCRVSEALALNVGDFHPARRSRPAQLEFTKTWKRANGAWKVGILKTDDSLRTIPIDKDLAALLKEHCKGRPADEYMFVDGNGDPVKYFDFEDAWTAATVRMKDPAREGGHLRRKPTIYWLRHSHGAWLLEKGIDIITVSRRLGHSSIRTTGDIYGHTTAGSQQAVVAALDSLGG